MGCCTLENKSWDVSLALRNAVFWCEHSVWLGKYSCAGNSGKKSSLKRRTGMHRTPPVSHICRRCEPSLKGGDFFLYSLYVNFSYLHQYSGVICQMSCLQARHCNARICLLKTRACLLNIEHTYYHVETENVFIIFFFHNIS